MYIFIISSLSPDEHAMRPDISQTYTYVSKREKIFGGL